MFNGTDIAESQQIENRYLGFSQIERKVLTPSQSFTRNQNENSPSLLGLFSSGRKQRVASPFKSSLSKRIGNFNSQGNLTKKTSILKNPSSLANSPSGKKRVWYQDGFDANQRQLSLLNEAKIKIKALADLSSDEEIEDDSMVSKNRLQKIKEAIENSEVSNSLNSSKTSTTSILPTQHGKFLKRTQKMPAKEIKRFIEKHKNDPNFPESASKRDEIINAQISALLKLREPRSQPNIPRPPQNKIMSPTKRTQTNLSNKKPLGFSYLKMLGSSKDERGRRRTDFQPQVPSSPLNLSFSNQKSIQKSTVSSKNQSFSSNHSRGTSNSKKQWAINKALGKSPNSKGIKMLGDIGKGNTLGKAMMGHLK